ncbi:flagellar assembly peptidoglycan hydrolase FlgJ [Burkholderia pseudomallei]|uniref:flagellar assembly peptidoglycan hydrolase FlgJ n=1 Tax=Burkholderia pseudomallei TaxID=28450 RepID=UPI000537F8B1|nr:flagellar assembly peptidoglycan hydrolase FlgJ [Burkholderia pseudomallei]KGU61016.1 flagellar rod assembly protein/muramidase FlgJ [Burkholderia pseudomallei MSHR543]
MTTFTKPNDLSQRFALDVQGFDALRSKATAAAPREGVKMVAGQFDAMFTQMMLKSMRDATPSDGLLDSSSSKMYTSMLDQQLAQQMSSKGIGVADALTKQLLRNANVAPDAQGEGGLAAMNALAKAYANSNGAPGNGNSAQADAFVEKMALAAQAASATTGIPARFIVGQAALESGWGKREIRGANGESSYNVFGIKATKGWTGRTVSAVTTEYVNGKPHRVVAQFRAYDSYEHAMTDYANLLKNNPRYASVLNAGHNAEGFAHGMQKAGYATDPHYAKKLISIMQQIG